MLFSIHEIDNLDEAWPELRALFAQFHEYRVGLTGEALREDWEGIQRRIVEFGEATLVLLARGDDQVAGFANARIL